MEGCGRRFRRSYVLGFAQLRMEGCGGEWLGVLVPRLFLCVGALHPIRRQYTSSVRVHRHITGAPPAIYLLHTSPHATVTRQSSPLCDAVTSAHTDHTFTCSKGRCTRFVGNAPFLFGCTAT